MIDEVAQATRRSGNAPIIADFSAFPTEEELFGIPVRHGLLTAEKAILGRRSAVAMDGSTAISKEVFFRTLARLMPTRDGRSMPWDAISWRPRIHLGLFVHRVEGVPRGLYALVRDPDKVAALKDVMRREFRWQRLPSCPPGLPLYLLQEGDCRALAATVSCGQDIAGDGAFSLGMIADYMDSLTKYGAAFYRNLFWEAGMVGQVLYLEAEEAGIRSTGIGCYFDDPVHESSASCHANGRASITSPWVAQWRTHGSPRYLHTTSRKSDERINVHHGTASRGMAMALYARIRNACRKKPGGVFTS